MTLAQWLWTALVGAGCVYWLVIAVGVVRVIRTVPILGRSKAPDPPRWPKVSVIIPACNEGADLEEAMRSKLAEDYPDVEFVLVDDRSTDDTGAIVDRMAAEDARVSPLHITHLPSGWLGKLHAMHQGLRAARGEWLLFSDADIRFTPGALKRAVALCHERNLDHLTVFPSVWPVGMPLDAAMAGFTRLLVVGARLWEVHDPDKRAAMGVGAFNLVRRGAFERTPGFEWLKLEVADDLALGQMLKRSGARTAVANGRDQLGLYFQRTMKDLARGAERIAAFTRFSVVRAILLGVVLLALELAPFLGCIPSGVPGLALASACVAVLAVASSVAINRWMRHPILPALLVPVGSLLIAAMILRGGVVPSLRGGLRWRGTLYPADALLEGQRVELV